MGSSCSLRVSRVLRASPEQIHRAWTEPQLMQRWMGEEVEAEVRVGGRYRRVVEGGDAGTFVHVGEYVAIEPTRIVQTFGLEGVENNPFRDEEIEILLKPVRGGRTKVVLIDRWTGPALTPAEERDVDQAWGDWLMRAEALFVPPEESDGRAAPVPPGRQAS